MIALFYDLQVVSKGNDQVAMTSKYETREDVGKSNEQKSSWFFFKIYQHKPLKLLNNTMDNYD